MGFLISRIARDKYQFDQSLFESSGNIVFRNFASVQKFSMKLKDIQSSAGEINAMNLIHEIFQYVIQLYIQQENPQMLEKAFQHLNKEIKKEKLDETLYKFEKEFPSHLVYRGEKTIKEYLNGISKGISNRQQRIEDILLLWLTNINPACRKYNKELFSDIRLKKAPGYQSTIADLERFFATQPFFGPKNQNLIAMLRSPAIAVPHSLSGQLEYIRENWGKLLGEFLDRLLSGLDWLKEEAKAGGMGPGETLVYDFSDTAFDDEYEKFTEDLEWMPNLVLIAKSTYVWLSQLSKIYQRSITRLDQIPDEELELLKNRGFTGLWLIGVWERSQASKKIKQMCGNPEALASAYSIYQYKVAEDLGGEAALRNLKDRAWQRGIRLASDMVPNHMGIDSPWLVEHPDWFLSLDYCPYPSYSFNGPNLSSDHRVGIYLEDHYFDRTDAAVVFKWVNHSTGETRYIYHGNDGTSMPWNDTAQLNYLKPEVREAVIKQIFSVAGQFPIIRFDAAMTLTKRHYQRLWFPEPGSGGDIPTRNWHGMNKKDFSKQMPEEFWRQVVDHFSNAQSDTLLLAEAFWLMEAYFVRTLGMHRVYNSAFMNFLKNEDNAKFRLSIKNILQFNPEILKRFVNFMNNPDEDTAVAQFGKDDKYLGVCTLMVTLPGLPMFGHGQIEGFTEKYGMEYRQAYWDETPDQHLIYRHEREIFPLMRKRYLFSEVQNFLFYDFFTPEGWVNEDVIAYSNNFSGRISLVIYHNKYAETSGWIKRSVAFLDKSKEKDLMIQRDLAEGLNLTANTRYFTIYKDQDSNLEFIRNSQELFNKGLFIELKAFKKYVFLDFREVEDDEQNHYAQLEKMLNGKGVPSISKTLKRHFYNPLLKPFQELIHPDISKQLAIISKESKRNIKIHTIFPKEKIEEKLKNFLEALQSLNQNSGENPSQIAKNLCEKLEKTMNLLSLEKLKQEGEYFKKVIQTIDFIILFILQIEKVLNNHNANEIWLILEEWLLDEELKRTFTLLEITDHRVQQYLELIKVMLIWQQYEGNNHNNYNKSFFSDPLVKKYLKVNQHNSTFWFHKESAEDLIERIFIAKLFHLAPAHWGIDDTMIDYMRLNYQNTMQMQSTLKESQYQWDPFLSKIGQ